MVNQYLNTSEKIVKIILIIKNKRFKVDLSILTLQKKILLTTLLKGVIIHDNTYWN